MLVLLSPAKRMTFDTPLPEGIQGTEPRLKEEANILVERARQMSPGQLQSLMHISDDLAQLNYERFQAFQQNPDAERTHPALFTFDGDVYRAFEPTTLDKKALNRAQAQVRILSGLYGVLRPLDRIQPYRLEMGRPLHNPRGENLYEFWRTDIADILNKDIGEEKAKVVINLASDEYASAVDASALTAPMVTPVFKDESKGKFRVMGVFAKRARGAMARWIVENGVSSTAALRKADMMGYSYAPDQSTETRLVFTRPESAR
jgi:hypothetical protein